MTVTELARLTGYSISTVSKALSDSREISAEAKEKILSVAKETGYYKKAITRKKRIGEPRTVGLVLDGYEDFRLIRNLCRELEKRDITAVMCMSYDAAVTLGDHLCVDSVLFLDGESHACSVPSFAFTGDIFATCDMLEAGFTEEPETKEETDDFSTPQSKEDIWLF